MIWVGPAGHAYRFVRSQYSEGAWPAAEPEPWPACANCEHSGHDHAHVACAGADECWPNDGTYCQCQEYVPVGFRPRL